MLCVLRLAVAVLCLSAACAGQNPPPPSDRWIDPFDLYPLRAGNAWSYDVDTGEASTTLAVTRVASFDGHLAEVHTGSAVMRYQVSGEGIRAASGDAWIIRAPVEEGATWQGRGGRIARVISINTVLQTPAGQFDRCVEVLETGGKLDLEVRTVYCPGVGPVSVRSTMRSSVSDRVVTVSAQLRGYEVSPSRASDR
ncbi:MAG: hypothetical protein WCF10_13780 [Polyangiales bacterium]